MPIPQEISDIWSNLGAPAISELAVPTFATGLAVALLKGAKALEQSASEPALKYVSDLLLHGNLANVGKLGTTLIPVIFDRIFGPKPMSVKFISRSILATVLFWLLLLTLKHANWGFVWDDYLSNLRRASLVIPMWLIVDWISLTKSRYLLRSMSRQYALTSIVLFFFFDMIASYLIPLIVGTILIMPTVVEFLEIPGSARSIIAGYVSLEPVTQYVRLQGNDISLNSVLVPSTLLTSSWTFLLVLTCFLTNLLVPLEKLRRFTAFWFRDVEKHPLTSIARVAATLIIACATVIKVIRWV